MYIIFDHANEASTSEALPPTVAGFSKDLSFVRKARKYFVEEKARAVESAIKGEHWLGPSSPIEGVKELLFKAPEALEGHEPLNISQRPGDPPQEPRITALQEPLIAWAVAVHEALPNKSLKGLAEGGFYQYGPGFFPNIDRNLCEGVLGDTPIVFRGAELKKGNSLREILWRFLAFPSPPGKRGPGGRALLLHETRGFVDQCLKGLYNSFGPKGLELYLELVETPYLVGKWETQGPGGTPDDDLLWMRKKSAFCPARSLRVPGKFQAGPEFGDEDLIRKPSSSGAKTKTKAPTPECFYPFQSFADYVPRCTKLFEEDAREGETSWDR